MNELNQMPFDDAEFAENPEQRCPCILLLDTSGSMHGAPINQLNEALRALKQEIMSDSLAAKRVELAIVTFGPVEVKSGFSTIDVFEPPTLEASGLTPIGEAIEKALELLEQRKLSYRKAGIKYYRPWIFMITDGSPTDDVTHAAARISESEKNKEFSFFAVGVQGADIAALKKISVREPLMLRGLAFRELFSWLSSSLSSVSHSTPGDQVSLPSTSGWQVV